MEKRTIEDEINAILAAAHDKGAEAASGKPSIPDVDLNDPAASFVITAAMSTDRILTLLVPVINGIEDALVRLARELDERRGA